MKKIITSFILLFVLSFSIQAQNLVPNPSFEHYTQCPQTFDVVSYAAPWCSLNGTDLFNSCDNINFPSYTGIPYNDYYSGHYRGYQYPRTGNGMASFNVFLGGGTLYRETFSNTLIDTLRKNKTYCITFYINLCNPSKYAVDRMGMFISKSFHPCDTTYNVILTPTIQSPSGVYLTDSLNWMKISGTYIASGGEKYILIGNFYDVTNTSRIVINPTGSSNSAAYYIDDVSIEEIKPVIVQNDTTLSFCDSVLLGNNLDSAGTYSWWPNKNISDTTSPNPLAWPDSTITYHVTKNQCSSVTTDSVKITVVGCNVGISNGQNYYAKKLYPNPNEGLFTIEYKLERNGSCEIYNLEGELIFTIYLEKDLSEKEINLKHLNAGMYYYSIKEADSTLIDTSASGTDLKNFADSSLASTTSNVGQVVMIAQQFATGDTSGARARNQAMVAIDCADGYHKTVNEIFLNTWALGFFSFSPQDSVTLHSIAM